MVCIEGWANAHGRPNHANATTRMAAAGRTKASDKVPERRRPRRLTPSLSLPDWVGFLASLRSKPARTPAPRPRVDFVDRPARGAKPDRLGLPPHGPRCLEDRCQFTLLEAKRVKPPVHICGQ